MIDDKIIEELKMYHKFAIDTCREHEIRYAEIWDLLDTVEKFLFFYEKEKEANER